jgi:hypothetical protein
MITMPVFWSYWIYVRHRSFFVKVPGFLRASPLFSDGIITLKVVYSGFVKNAPRLISTLVTAHPERGKSTKVQKWHCLGVLTLQDMTSYSIDRQIQELSGKELKYFHHLMIPDLEKIGSRNRVVRNKLLKCSPNAPRLF